MLVAQGSRAIPEITSDWVNRSYHRELIIRQMGRAAVAPLVERLQSESDPDMLWPCLEALCYIGPEASDAVSTVTAELANPDPMVRICACRALMSISPDQGGVKTALLNVLNDAKDDSEGKKYNDLLVESTFALGNVAQPGDAEVINALLPLLEPGSDRYYVPCAAYSLFKLGWHSDQMLDLLTKRALDPSCKGFEQSNTLRALAWIGNRESYETLERIYREGAMPERCGVLVTLAERSARPEDLPILTAALCDPECSNQGSAIMSLLILGSEAKPALDALKDLQAGKGGQGVCVFYKGILEEAIMRIERE